ncbi:MAG: GntR family transcriptional regulator [Gammaproteobacteria bacterium]
MDQLVFSRSFTLDRSRSAAAQVYDFLREEIVNMQLKPGAELSRNELAAHFALSITPVRDALMRLEEDGLVDVFPQHATRVRGISIDSARQAHFLRLALELEIVRTLAQQNDPAVNQALKLWVTHQRLASEHGDLKGFTDADQNFHRAMYKAANAEELWHLIRARSGNMDRLRRLHLPLNGKAEAILQDHGDIAEAIARGDGAGAQDIVRRHLSGTLSVLDSLREQFPGYWVPER